MFYYFFRINSIESTCDSLETKFENKNLRNDKLSSLLNSTFEKCYSQFKQLRVLSFKENFLSTISSSYLTQSRIIVFDSVKFKITFFV